jgi:hypothetical protein
MSHNVTFVRGAKPKTNKKKDLPARKPIKGGVAGLKNA